MLLIVLIYGYLRMVVELETLAIASPLARDYGRMRPDYVLTLVQILMTFN